MAFTAETGSHKVTRSDIFLVDPRALVVDWRKNLSRNGEEPPVDDALIELARDMMPKKGAGEGEDGSSGQLNPILVRPLSDRRLEVVGGFRRMRAALWLIQSGECPDFKVKYVVSRLSDAEAALVNLSENIQREDPRPIQLAHAVRALTEDYGLTMRQVAGRLKRSEVWLSNLLNLVMLPSPIQESVANGKTQVSAALELTKLPEPLLYPFLHWAKRWVTYDRRLAGRPRNLDIQDHRAGMTRHLMDSRGRLEPHDRSDRRNGFMDWSGISRTDDPCDLAAALETSGVTLSQWCDC